MCQLLTVILIKVFGQLFHTLLNFVFFEAYNIVNCFCFGKSLISMNEDAFVSMLFQMQYILLHFFVSGPNFVSGPPLPCFMAFDNNLTKERLRSINEITKNKLWRNVLKSYVGYFLYFTERKPLKKLFSFLRFQKFLILLPLQPFKNKIIMTWYVLHKFSNCNFWITLKPVWIRTSKVSLVVDLGVKNISEHIWNHKVPPI